eukprot:5516010-Pleurochrysis_carterae.AAC.1
MVYTAMLSAATLVGAISRSRSPKFCFRARMRKSLQTQLYHVLLQNIPVSVAWLKRANEHAVRPAPAPVDICSLNVGQSFCSDSHGDPRQAPLTRLSVAAAAALSAQASQSQTTA